VAVAIGLDDRQHAAAGSVLSHPAQVVGKGGRVDDGPRRGRQNAPSP
jgi:hypothetical protein